MRPAQGVAQQIVIVPLCPFPTAAITMFKKWFQVFSTDQTDFVNFFLLIRLHCRCLLCFKLFWPFYFNISVQRWTGCSGIGRPTQCKSHWCSFWGWHRERRRNIPSTVVCKPYYPISQLTKMVEWRSGLVSGSTKQKIQRVRGRWLINNYWSGLAVSGQVTPGSRINNNQ